MPEERIPFHHKHLPSLTKWTRAACWKLSHLYFPIVIHYMTDKYTGRLHHFVVDMIYVVFTVIFAAANIGLAMWFYLYFTPADIDVHAVTTAHIVSGNDTVVSVVYKNDSRAIDDVAIEVFLPDGFIPAASTNGNNTGQPTYVSLGHLEPYAQGLIEIPGAMFGDVDHTYAVRAMTSYTSFKQRHEQFTTQHFTVEGTSFDVRVQFPDTVTYDTAIEGTVHYTNNSHYDLDTATFTLNFPTNFAIDSIDYNTTNGAFDAAHPELTITGIAANEEGDLVVHGRFIRTDIALSGDQQSEFLVSVRITVGGETSAVSNQVVFASPDEHTGIRVITPRLSASITGTSIARFGDTISATIVVNNIGDSPIEQIALFGDMHGSPLLTHSATVHLNDNGVNSQVTGAQTAGANRIPFPVLSQLPVGESRTFTISIPTSAVDAQQVSSSLSVFGSGYSPELDVQIGLPSMAIATKYDSQVDLSSALYYYGPNGEELGYGPYPPQAWQPTAMRVVLKVENVNNPLRNVVIRATLPGQVEWTNLYSVTAGSELLWNSATRTIEWHIDTLDPQSSGYGAQFEVVLTPNHLQIGLTPHLADNIQLTATDQYTGRVISAPGGAVVLPVAVVQ
ncbi:MAG: hypothetical protein HYV32_00415 [Candidatus Kerfeldbacteria bacterium]|nr:hypothetical protein [Candidatus Kerfeldbacteria bacterium]